MSEGGDEVTEFFELLRRDGIVGNEQIQQMSESFQGAATTMKEIMERLKAAEAEKKTLLANNKQLTDNNKQLVESNKSLTEALSKLRVGGGRYRGNQNRDGGGGGGQEIGKCNICNQEHKKPFKEHCWELERNKAQRPANWESRL